MNKLMPTKNYVSRITVALFCFCVTLSAFAQQPAEPGNNNSPTAGKVQVALNVDNDERYRIGPGDVLDIRILNRPNLSREAVRVEGNGVIRMPLIETEIIAACKTEGELAREIAERYTRFYRKPQVDVFIKEYHSKQVAIIGAGIFVMTGRVRDDRSRSRSRSRS